MTDEEVTDYKALSLLHPTKSYDTGELLKLFSVVVSNPESALLHQKYTQKEYYTNDGGVNCMITPKGKDRLERVSMLNEVEQLKRDNLILSKNKKPTWKERNWLWIAVFAFLIGFAADISKELVKQRLPKQQIEKENQIPQKSDTSLLQ